MSEYKDKNLFLQAIVHDDLRVVQKFLSGGGNPNIPDSNGDTPLIIAAKKGYVEIVKALLRAGANVHAKGDRNRTPLHVAAQCGENEIVKLLLNDSNIEEVSGSGCTALHFAAANNRLDAVETLLAHNAKVDAKNDEGNLPLHLAVISGSEDITALLVRAGRFTIYTRNHSGQSPRELAGSIPRYVTLEFLEKVFHESQLEHFLTTGFL